ncbi:complement C3-like isoform X2 [Patiria miniata]|uniref:NTR domain-containing protein n=1 Tax=Patiria miniata TaxID=46514 RepID=A0A913Z7N9_PATMI|nr:complement C3-like isoform X2 [Patiria miniata]
MAQYFIVAPNLVRVDVQETILVSVLGTGENQIPVTLYFQLTGSNDRISETTVFVRQDESQEARLRIRRDQLPQLQTSGQQFVTLVASANTAQLSIDDRRVILLSYQAGFVFIQTDKPLYTPKQRVDIRVVALDQDMVPVNNEMQVDIISPDDIIVERYKQRPVDGFLTLSFVFPSNPVFGNWSVSAYYGHQFKASSTVQFEAKEYVLPKFYVEVAPQSLYIVPETQNLISKVTARYIFGEPVVGNFYVKYGVLEDDGSLMDLQSKEGRLNEVGEAFQDLDMNDVKVENWAETLMGKRLVIQAFVTDTATGETINTNNTQVTFSRTPYKFNWDLTQRYFKKGLSFSVKANVQFMSGLPAEDVPVIASATALQGGRRVDLEGAQAGAQAGGGREHLEKISGPQGEVDFRLDVPAAATEITITLRTNNPDLVNANTEGTITVLAQASSNNEYLVVRVPSGDIRRVQRIGRQSTVEVQLTHPDNVGVLNYFVIAGGRIVHKGAKNQVNLNTALGFEVTHEMAPSSRVVAYYTDANGNVVADALLIDVEEKCKNPIGLSFLGLPSEGSTYKSERSGQNVQLEILAKEDTNVGLVAVDEAVFKLRNYHRLTQKKVFKRMAGYDLGCGPGGGQTSATIFKNAGVTVMTNAQLDVPHREALGCPEPVRRARRSANDTEREQILSNYEGVNREYCEKGMRELSGSVQLTCAQRAKLMAGRKGLQVDSPEIRAFFDCCSVLESSSDRGRVDAGAGGVNLEDILVRSNFPESWLFDNVITQSLRSDDDDGRVLYPTTLPDSVTTWVIEAVGVHMREVHEMCVAEPIKLEVRPPFFLDIGMPYSVQRFEQIEIVASVFNYGDDELEVTVYLRGKEGLCSIAQPGEYSEGITIQVEAKKPASVKFVIVPLEVKNIPIEIVAMDASGQHRDAIEKDLTVRPEGYEKKISVPVTLDPANYRGSPAKQDGGADQFYFHSQNWGDQGEEKQIDFIRYSVNRNAIPGSHKARMSLVGNVLGSVIDTVLGGLDKLLRIPGGCGEQTMLGLAPNVYVYTYLKHTDQFTAALETSSERYVFNGVKHELTFRKNDGSYAAFTSRPSSTWLTAFVAKIFCKAKDFAFVDDSNICKAMEWLITQRQSQDDGSFTERNAVIHKEMSGGVQGKASMTAFVLISLLECECDAINKDDSVAAATALLEDELPDLTRPYAIAITAYALALANSIRAQEAIQMLKDIAAYNAVSDSRYWAADDSSFGGGQKPYWYSARPKAIEVETTSYALLALLQMEEIQYTHAIVNWLTNQENYNGGFVSTQDTVMALQALSEYAYKVQQYDIDINCEVKCDESEFDEDFSLNPANALVREQRNIDVPDMSQEMNVFISTEGAGMGQFKFEATYYIPEPDVTECDFDLLINEDENLQLDRPEDDNKEYLSYDIQVRYLRGEKTGMAILDVGLYTGYKAVQEDLQTVMDNSGGRVERYEETDHSVVFYFEDIPGLEAIRIQFRAEREFNVGKVQPVAVHVYDYYNPTEECVKFISPKEGSNLLGKLCVEDTCVCAAGKCAVDPIKKGRDYKVYDMTQMACASKAHFAYEVTVTDVEDKGNFQFYTMTIDAPLKQGLDHVVKDATRVFAKSKSCDTPDLQMTKYLVIGSGGLPTKDDVGQDIYKYVIDDRTFFYEYPTILQVNKSKKWQRIHAKLTELKQELVNGEGCAL